MSSLTLPEYYGDFAATAVAIGGYTAGSGVLNVTSTSGMGNGSQQFHFTIFDVVALTAKAAGKVTAVNSGTQWAVTMTLDANANATDVVVITLSAGAMNQIRADLSQFGPLSALPTVAKAGDRYKQTDGPYDFIYSGSAWQAFWNGYPVTLPPSGGWTSEGLSASQAGTVHYTNGFGYLIGSNANAVASQYRASPGSTPFSFTARWSADYSGIVSNLAYGNAPAIASLAGFAVGFRDSGGKYLIMSMAAQVGGSDAFIAVDYLTAFNGSDTNLAIAFATAPVYGLLANKDLTFRIRNNGTNLYFQVSIDGGQTFYTFYSEAITAHLADAASVCWGVHTSGSSATVSLYDWTQGT